MKVTFNKFKEGELHKTYIDMTLAEFIDMLGNQKMEDGIKVNYIPIDNQDNKLMVVSWK